MIERLKEQTFDYIELPMEEGDPLEIKVRKPNLIAMVNGGNIPNPLIPTVHELIFGKQEAPKTKKKKSQAKEQEEQLKTFADMLEIYARACMVEPTYEEAYEYLNNEQVSTIYLYAIGELEGIKKFRDE